MNLNRRLLMPLCNQIGKRIEILFHKVLRARFERRTVIRIGAPSDLHKKRVEMISPGIFQKAVALFGSQKARLP
jgi:hypothetical protein